MLDSSAPEDSETGDEESSQAQVSASTDAEHPRSASRSPSPDALGDNFERERQTLWDDEARRRFHDMVTAADYTNRYRMHMKKKQRMIAQLEQPDRDIMLCDGSKDHQTKYQSVNWRLKDDLLYRKPEAGRVGKLRRHLDETEAWEVYV
jgi:hypothetical protein